MIDSMRGVSILLAWVLSTALEPARLEGADGCSFDPEYTFYSVSGVDEESVRLSMVANGPKDAGGKSRFALADWSVKWRWKVDTAGFVVPSTVEVECSGRVTLPKLSVADSTSVPLVRNWHDFVERLREHELRHLEHARIRARDIERNITAAHQQFGPQKPEQANKIAMQVIEGIRALDRAYDATTNHGKTEGAWSLSHS